MDGQLEQVQGVLTEFSRVEAGLTALREKHGNTVYEVSTTAGMDAAKAARAEIREPRHAVEKVRKAAKRPLLELGRRIDAEAIRITDAILAIETPIDDQIKGEEARRLAEKEAKRSAEVERLRLEAAAKLKAEEEQLAAQRAEIAKQQAEIAAERAKAEADAAAERKKIEAEAAAARRKAEAEAAEAKREAELELAAQRKAIAQQRAEIEAHERIVADAQAAEAKRLAYANAAVEARELALERERQKAREEAERIAAECPEEPPAAVNDAEAVPAASDDPMAVHNDPMAVWVDINDGWEALDIHDIDAVELWANWVMQEGERQAKELAEALADRVA